MSGLSINYDDVGRLGLQLGDLVLHHKPTEVMVPHRYMKKWMEEHQNSGGEVQPFARDAQVFLNEWRYGGVVSSCSANSIAIQHRGVMSHITIASPPPPWARATTGATIGLTVVVADPKEGLPRVSLLDGSLPMGEKAPPNWIALAVVLDNTASRGIIVRPLAT